MTTAKQFCIECKLFIDGDCSGMLKDFETEDPPCEDYERVIE